MKGEIEMDDKKMSDISGDIGRIIWGFIIIAFGVLFTKFSIDGKELFKETLFGVSPSIWFVVILVLNSITGILGVILTIASVRILVLDINK